MTFTRFVLIKREEFQKMGWQGEKKGEIAPGIVEMTRHFNAVVIC
jgi:hypothetical protein